MVNVEIVGDAGADVVFAVVVVAVVVIAVVVTAVVLRLFL